MTEREVEEKEKIRPVGYIRLTKTCKTHIPELIRRETETAPGGKIPYIINASTILLYNPKLDLESLLKSIDILKEDLKLRYRKST